MRKLLLLLISLGMIFWVLGLRQTTKPITPQPQLGVPIVSVSTEIQIPDGKEVNQAMVSAKTAYEALQKLANENKLEIKVKQYDFGVFVESINGISNTKDLSWIYFVNGKSAEVAADKANLKEGDKVEWKYIKPNF